MLSQLKKMKPNLIQMVIGIAVAEQNEKMFKDASHALQYATSKPCKVQLNLKKGPVSSETQDVLELALAASIIQQDEKLIEKIVKSANENTYRVAISADVIRY